MLYSKHLRTFGWSEENITRLDNLLWAHAIKAEEYYGLGFCTENLEYSVHAASEIRRHSAMDNYSCELYERAIRVHKQQKHNSRGLEKTFVFRESMRDFLKCYKEKNGDISSYDDQIPKYQFNTEIAQTATPFYFNEGSFKSAVGLLHDLKETQDARIKHAVKFGVLLGKVERKAYSDVVTADIQIYFHRELGLQNLAVPDILQAAKNVALFNQYKEIVKISKLDTVKIRSSDMTEEWIMRVEEIIQIGPVQGHYFTFVNGTYYIPAIQSGQVVYHEWTSTPKFLMHAYNRHSVQPITCFQRKVMMYPEPGNIDNPSYFLCADFKNPELIKPVEVSIYPDVGDILKVKGTGNQEWYGKVNAVNLGERKAYMQWYIETRRIGVWVATNGEDEIHFRSIIRIATATRTFGGFKITDT
jgi:hypothetical protein